MNIRQYSAGDGLACIRIFDSNCPLFFDASEANALEHWLTARDTGTIAYASNLVEEFYVLEHEGQVVACGGFYILEATHEAHMAWGMVASSCHKQGYGTALLTYRLEVLKNNKFAKSIHLDTSQHTYLFFELFGFQVTKITTDGYGPALDRYDMVLVNKNR